MIAFPWTSAAFLALTIALALTARKPREFDVSQFPMQVQQSGLVGIITSLAFLLAFAGQVTWWSPVPIIGAGVVLWFLMSLLPLFPRLVLEVISTITWLFGIVFAAAGMERFLG